MEQYFEKLLWQSRYIMLIAVIISFVTAFVVLISNIFDLQYIFELFWETSTANLESDDRKLLRHKMMVKVIELLDGFLIAGVLMIFSFGLYELYISRLEPAKQSPNKGKVLVIANLDMLKSKLGKVILMMLIVKVLSFTIDLKVSSPQELVYLAASVALVSLALFLTKDKQVTDNGGREEKRKENSDEEASEQGR